MTKRDEEIIDKFLDKLDNKTKNMLIKLLMTHDKKDIWIQQVPIYEDWEYQGHVIARWIKDYKYCIGVKNDAADYIDSLKDNEPHEVKITI